MSKNNEEQDKSEWTSYLPDEMTGGGRYGLCISCVVPRPVGVISTISSSDGNGIVNCAPFSYTGLLSHDPPTVAHGLCLSRGEKKDTLKNIEATGEWVFNVLTTEWLEGANQCSASYPSEVDELKETNLESLPSDIVCPPRVAKSSLSMEIKLVEKKELINDAGVHTTTIVIGRIVKFHVKKSILKDGPKEKPIVDLEKLKPCGRAGESIYYPVGTPEGSMLSMARPK